MLLGRPLGSVGVTGNSRPIRRIPKVSDARIMRRSSHHVEQVTDVHDRLWRETETRERDQQSAVCTQRRVHAPL
jgi:hypothetical protein